MKNIKVLNYAVNGLGLGHITRLISINRWIRRISGALGKDAEIYFLTSSECDTIAYQNDFAAFKIPSKNSLKQTGIHSENYRKIAKQWIWNSINLISPDILIVDTFPFGSFNELFDVLDLGFKKVFIYRAIRKEVAEEINFQKAITGYDKIITPVEYNLDDYTVPDFLEERVFKSGEIISRDIDELYPKEEARKLLGISQNSIVCYVTAGGGGDHELETFFLNLTDILKTFEGVEFIIGAGPLYKGKEYRSKNIHWLYRYNAIEYFNAFDFALSAGGYNSTHELLYTKIPSIFFPQQRHFDDQERRIENLYNNGLCLFLSSLNKEEVNNNLNKMLDPEIRNGIKCRLLDKFNTNDAFKAAAEILNGFVDENDIEHIHDFIPGSFFYSLKESEIPERTGLHTIRILDNNYHELKKLNKSLSEVSSYFDFDQEINEKFKSINENLYNDFIDYPLHNLALGYLKYIQNKAIDFKTGNRFLNIYLKNNYKPPKNIQQAMLDATNYIELLLNKKENINDLLANYIFQNNNERSTS